jgi:aminopeptidase N
VEDPNKLFERASRAALRFNTARGQITTEDLWNMPLRSSNNFDLEHVAQTANSECAATPTVTFVDEPKPNSGSDLSQLKLDVVKYVIAVKLAEKDEKLKAAQRASEKATLEALLAKKQGDALESLTEPEIKERLAKL